MDLPNDTEFLIDPEKLSFEMVKKKVRFSDTVTVYKDVPKKNLTDDVNIDIKGEPIFVPLHEIVGRSKFSMRTQMEEPVQCSFAAILLLFTFLFVFALIVWFVIQKLLIIEIETQVQPTSVSSSVRKI